ncbi:CatB-related O-acetyltransferase [Sphingomonas sanxanigenens]|uniref:CatB-related O-acetyltransferase n=1 Tax=Sphingomonas sanxanigenens TaxID=397260 RepID=UPI00046CE7A2|nr:CatB-related O-acetyltransferase [Sphingomonas sanxanigenens]
MGVVGKAIDKAKLFRWLRDQDENRDLRRFFRERHGIDVGLHSYGCFDRWRMPGPLVIGRYCSFAKTVRVVDANHPLDAITTHPMLYEKRFGVIEQDMIHAEPLVIEDDVWVGHNVVILPGCKFIGRGAVIGAGAIVTANVPAYAIVAGVPAKQIRWRFDAELQAALEASRWWELEPPAIRALLQSDPDVIRNPTAARVAAVLPPRG